LLRFTRFGEAIPLPVSPIHHTFPLLPHPTLSFLSCNIFANYPYYNPLLV
jgi:hypothetical protein